MQLEKYKYYKWLSLFFINNLPEATTVCVKPIPDDGKLYTTVKTVDKKKLLQEKITRAENWAEKWEMYLNNSTCKCQHFHIGNSVTTYTRNGVQRPISIGKVEFEKDLEVYSNMNKLTKRYVSEEL